MLFMDRLQNLVTGLAGSNDKKVSSTYVFQPRALTELHAMYREDWLAAKVVDIIPNDMTREGRDWQAEQAQIEAIEAVEKLPRINLLPKLNKALKMARLEGGAGIFIGIRGADHSKEMVLDRIGKDSLEYLHVLTQSEVTAGPRIRDVMSVYYDEPEYYEINGADGGQTRVHPSRFVRFVGAEILDRHYVQDNIWGDSVLQKVYSAIQNATSVQEHVASLIPEMKLDILYMPGLSEALKTPAGTQSVTSRFAYANQIKSMFHMHLLEGNGGNGDTAKGEKWEQKQISLAQMPELMQQYLKIAAGAADITLIRLLQDAPSGLGSNGESALMAYYDNIAARQTTELTPALNRIDEVIIRSATGSRDPAIFYTWSPLYGLSEKERADIFKAKAEAARTIAGNGGTTPALMPIEALSDALVNELIEDGTLSGLQNAIEQYGRLSEQEEDEADMDAAAGIDPPAEDETGTITDAQPRTLYVRRKVINGGEIVAWAKLQGFTSTLKPDDLHVTIMFSRKPVDWMKMGESFVGREQTGTMTVPPGGARMMERFDGGATVLLFSASELSWRHENMRREGASWDHEEYQPHVTISYEGAPADLRAIEPYRGKIELGPEIFEEVKEDWLETVTEE